MEIVVVVIILTVFLAMVAAFTRMAIQRNRDGKWPEDDMGTTLELFIAAVAGILAFFLYVQLEGPPTDIWAIYLYVSAMMFGYTAPDALENQFLEPRDGD